MRWLQISTTMVMLRKGKRTILSRGFESPLDHAKNIEWSFLALWWVLEVQIFINKYLPRFWTVVTAIERTRVGLLFPPVVR